MTWLWTLIANIISLFLTGAILPGIHVKNVWSAIITVLVISLLNMLVRPLLNLLSLPINFLTLGLFSLVITGLIIWLASTIVKGFDVDNFGWAILAGLVMAVINALLSLVLPTR